MIDLGATTAWETSKPLWSQTLRAGDGVPAFQVCNAELVRFCNAELVCFGLVLGLGGNDSFCVFVSGYNFIDSFRFVSALIITHTPALSSPTLFNPRMVSHLLRILGPAAPPSG